MQAEVLLLDSNIARLREADRIYQGHCQTVASNAYEIERAVLDADLVIGAVLVPGAKAPMLVSNDLVARMKSGFGAGGHRHRPGRVLRGLAAHDPRRPGVQGARVALLLRGQHAGRGAPHLDLRPDERDPAVRAGDRRPGLAGRPAVRPGPGPGAQHPRRAVITYPSVAEAHGLPAVSLEAVLA